MGAGGGGAEGGWEAGGLGLDEDRAGLRAGGEGGGDDGLGGLAGDEGEEGEGREYEVLWKRHCGWSLWRVRPGLSERRLK